jgi:hypothetical protein
MPRSSQTRRRALGVASLALAGALGLSACQPVGAAVSAGNAADTAPVSDTAPAATTAAAQAATPGTAQAATSVAARAATSAATGVGGPGSITLALTAPRAVSGHVSTTVSCATGRVYHAAATGEIEGYTVHLGASAVAYHGDGSYPTALAGSVVAPGGEAFALAGLHTTASLTGTGGSVPFTAVSARGHSLQGTLSWQCS